MPFATSPFLVKEPQRTYKWRASIGPLGGPESLDFLGIGSALGAVKGLFEDNANAKPTPPSIDFDEAYLQSVSVPQRAIAIEDLPYLGRTYRRPMGSSVSELTIVFQETAQGDVINALNQWKDLIYDDESGTYGLPVEYSTDIAIQLMNGFNIVHTVFELESCFPTQTANLELSYTESSQLLITQTFAVQNIKNNTQGLLAALQDPLANISIPGVDLTRPDLGIGLGGVFQ